MFQFNTQGVCSKCIYFEVEDHKVKNVSYIGGCNGNLKGICGGKKTSCPDQLAKALKAYKEEIEK